MPNNPVLPLGSQPDTDNFQVYTQRPVVRFLKQGVQPPSQVYVTASDNIQVGCASSQVNEAVTITYRLLRADGELIEGQFIVHPPADRSIKVYSEDLAEGFLLSVSCKAAVATTRGQTFVRVFLTHPELGAGQPSYMLMADYVTTAMAPAHPNGRVLAPSEGPGNRRQILTSVPGPGSTWLATVPANARWIVRAFVASLTTDAVAGNRYIFTEVFASALIAFAGGADKVQAPSITCQYSGAPLTPNLSPVAVIGMLPLPPDLLMLAGDQIGTGSVGIDPGDQWSAASLDVEEWLDNV